MDDITEAFANISVEDFLRTTSAIKTHEYEPDFAAQYGDGVNNWKGWTDMLVESCVSDLQNEEFAAFAVLHNPRAQRFFKPDDDETAFDFANRLNREALDMEATWIFSAMFVPGRTYSEDEVPPVVDADNRDELQRALEEGVLHMGICWFSRGVCDEIVKGVKPVVEEAGMITYNQDTEEIEQTRGAIEPEHNPFHNVLGA